MGILIFWGICAVFAAMIASGKNRSSFAWFLMGLLFGPIGALIILCLPTVAEVATETDEKTCPHCAETIKRAALVCRYCNRDLDSLQAPVEPMIY